MSPEQRRLRRRFAGSTLLGAAIAFPFVAGLGAALEPYTKSSASAFLILGLGVGLLEGASVGIFQGRVLAQTKWRVDALHWMSASGIGTALAWFVIILPSVLDGQTSLHPEIMPPLWMAALILVVFLFGGLGARALRLRFRQADSWLGAVLLGWGTGSMFVVAAISLVPDGSPDWLFSAAFVGGALAMSAWAGWICGGWLAKREPTAG